MYKKMLTLFFTAVLLMFVTACDITAEEYKVTFKNLTGVEISELYIAPENSKGEMKNYLNENFTVDGVIELSLGKLTEEDVSQGFAIEVYNAEDGTSNDFGMLKVNNGSTVTLYLDVWGLAVAVDKTDEEVQKEIEQASEDAQSVTEGEE